MPTNVLVPPLGESVTEAVLLSWTKKEGEYVSGDEPLCSLETDKANVDLPAPVAGLLKPLKEPGDTVHVGEIIARIDEAPAGVSAAAASAAASGAAKSGAAKSAPADSGPVKSVKAAPGGGVARASTPAPAAPAAKADDLRPSVRRIAEETGVNPATVKGTGPHGQVLKEDILRQANSSTPSNGNGRDEAMTDDDGPPPSPAAWIGRSAGADNSTTKAPQPEGNVPASAAHPTAGQIAFDAAGEKRVPMSKIRKRIAQRLVSAQQTAAILTTFNEVDCSTIFSIRSKYKEKFQEVYGVGLGLMSFFARAVVLCLREYPRVNAEIDGDDIIYHNFVHLGIAVSTDRGLAVPVLRNAEAMSFAKIESEIKRLAGATREGRLGLNELTGGTFTITNGGVFGSLLSTPILNPPQSGILGMHTIQKRPVAIGDKVEIRPMMYTALSYDHRLVDGKESVSFLVRLKEYLEDPARLMLEI